MRTRDEPSAAPVRAGALRTLIAPHRDALLLGTLWAILTALNMLWTALNARPPHWDEANHLGNSVILFATFSWSHLSEWVQGYFYYPPFAYWIADAFYVASGHTDQWVAILSQSVFLALLIGATYGIGRQLWSSRVGLLAAFLAATTPMLANGFKDFMLDAPLSAMAILALYLLIRSESFAVRRWSLLFGLACGLGMLTKWTFGFMLVVPALVAAISALRRAVRERSLSRPLTILGSLALSIATMAIWYASNARSIVADSAVLVGCGNCYWYAQVEGDPPIGTIRSIFWYLWNLVSHQLFLVPFALFVVGVVFLFVRRDAARVNRYPILYVSGIYVIQTLLVSKDPRYTLPIVPGVAILATYWIDLVGPRVRSWLTGAIVAYGAVTFLAVSFGAPFLPQAVEVRLDRSEFVSELPDFTPAGDFVAFHGLRMWSQQSYPLGRPSADRWYQEELFQLAASESPDRTMWYHGPPVDTIWFNDVAMRYYAWRYTVYVVPDLNSTSFAAIRAYPGEPIAVPAGFRETRSFALPDTSVLHLYRRG
jgi:4-amino-4-deoxy-L-arabinose transferase-like glycosyltransferase